MLDLGFPRALSISTLTIAALFAARTAHADPPAPPTLAVAPAAVPADAPSKEQAPKWSGPSARFELGYGTQPPPPVPQTPPYYPPETHMHSTPLVAGGVVLLSFGVVGVFAGSAMVGAHEPTGNGSSNCLSCNFDGSGSSGGSSRVVLKPGFQEAGIGTLIGSVVAIGAAIPMLVIGSKQVPYADSSSPAAKAARLSPSLRVAPGSATLTWQF
jgi:hypothetical protein